MKIRDYLLSEETLFRNEEVFNPDYLPEEFLYRNAQLRSLSACAKPALRGSKPLNAFLFGVPATGKTTSVRFVFDELKKSTDKVVCVHINCQIYSTPYKIFSEIHRVVFGFAPPETGVPLSSIYDKMFLRLGREKKSLIVCLDDVNFLFLGGNANEVFYQILRAYEVHPVHTAVWSISTQNDNHKLEDRVRSVHQHETISFHPYSKSEMVSILKNRADAGFYPNVMNKSIVEILACHAQDVRHGIELLRKAAMNAEGDASRVVREAHAQKAIEQLKKEKPVLKKMTFSEDEELILSVLGQKKECESGALFGLVCRKKKIGYTTFYRHLKSLEGKNKVVVESVKKERGQTSMIRLKD